MWRLLNGHLPVDDVLQKFQIHGPSKCHCCLPAQGETLQHVFSTGQLAGVTWMFFERSLGVSVRSVAVRSRCSDWWMSPVKGKALRWVSRILPVLILWFLWRARNASRFEGCKVSGVQVRVSICSELQRLAQIHFPGIARLPCQWEGFLEVLSSARRVLVAKAVRWTFPVEGSFKLNTDGCSMVGGSGGGGVIRDSRGKLIIAFADSFGSLDSLQAEARALLLGLQLGYSLGISQMFVESDCLVLVNCLKGVWGVPAVIRPVVRPVRLVTSAGHQFGHCYLEGNMVADSLTTFGVECCSRSIFTSASQLPLHSRGLLSLDMQNFCSFRFSLRM